jgi:uracil-DNA glycosylase family 4
MASAAYRQLLDATIRHLEGLQEQGVTSVALRAESLQTLVTPTNPVRPASPAPAARPTSPGPAAPQPRTAPATLRPAAPAPAAAPVRSPVAPMPTAAPVIRRPATALATLTGDPRRAAFEELRQRALACTHCPNLAASRRQVVFGVGNPEAELVFVGEAPGQEEDRQGEPFVGEAGQLLTKIIVAMGLDRDRVYIANVVKCRPDTPGQHSGNRKPTPDEMSTCFPYLADQIELIRPRVLVALGATAIEGLLGQTSAGVGRLRGSWLNYQGIPVMATYHPAYLLRNTASSVKRLVWEDMLAVMERLGLPISEKQRGYFQKSA